MTKAAPIVDEQIVPWVRLLLTKSSALDQRSGQGDPCWRHAYGIAQGAGFSLNSRQWPPFPTTSGSAFMSLVAAEKLRRDQNQTHPGGQTADPFNAQVTGPNVSPDALPAGLDRKETQAEQLIKGMLKQAKAFDKNDPGWRHAYGIAQGFGAFRRSKAWSPFPTSVPGRFLALVQEEAGRRGSAPAGGAFPPSAVGANEDDTATRVLPATARPSGPPNMRAGFRQPSAPPQVPAPPKTGRHGRPAGPPPRPAPPPVRPSPPPARPSPPPAKPTGSEGAFRALPTLMDADSDSSDELDNGSDAFRSVPTMLEAGGAPEEDNSAFRSVPTMLEAGEEAGQGGEAFRSVPTMLDSSEQEPIPLPNTPPPAPSTRAAPPSRPKMPSMREAMTGEQAKKDRRQRAAQAEQVDQIGEFDVLGRLGKGAMGQVFKGRSPDGSIAAIKVLHQRFGKSKRVKARFMREAKAVERIQHPAVVRYIASGEEPGVGQWIAMEFVEGLAMHELIKKRRGKPFDLDATLDYFVQVSKGMRAAHASGVIHRDLKPENVLIRNDDQVKITDFSLARRDQDSMLLTRPGQVMGTPHFMSPEQARGEAVDARTDIYSMGAMLYVMLTGRFPFPDGSVSEVIAAHCEQPRPDPREQNSECTQQLADICKRLMAIDRNDRYQSVDALLEELNELYGFDPKDEEVIEGALPPGTKVDEFMIGDVLGAGGMGAVYRAKQNGKEIALKVLPPQPGRAPQDRVKDVRRFHNEAKLAKRVNSRHVYQIHKFGVDSGGQAFIAASLASGMSLRDVVARVGFLKPDDLIPIARGICQALQAIHEAGIVHRDITPANVMLQGDWDTADDANVCIIDFGLAIPMERDRDGKGQGGAGGISLAHVARKDSDDLDDIDEESLFLEDLPGGTPAYMASEVLEDPSLVDGRTDLYSLGATLYHAATGHPPYQGETIQQVLYQQRSVAPPPITQFNADFPEDLQEFILQLLSTRSDYRPKSAKLCLNKLHRMQDPTAIKSWRPEPTARAARVEQEIVYAFSWATFFLGALVGVVVLVGGVILLGALGIELPPALLKLLGAKG